MTTWTKRVVAPSTRKRSLEQSAGEAPKKSRKKRRGNIEDRMRRMRVGAKIRKRRRVSNN